MHLDKVKYEQISKQILDLGKDLKTPIDNKTLQKVEHTLTSIGKLKTDLNSKLNDEKQVIAEQIKNNTKQAILDDQDTKEVVQSLMKNFNQKIQLLVETYQKKLQELANTNIKQIEASLQLDQDLFIRVKQASIDDEEKNLDEEKNFLDILTNLPTFRPSDIPPHHQQPYPFQNILKFILTVLPVVNKIFCDDSKEQDKKAKQAIRQKTMMAEDIADDVSYKIDVEIDTNIAKILDELFSEITKEFLSLRDKLNVDNNTMSKQKDILKQIKQKLA